MLECDAAGCRSNMTLLTLTIAHISKSHQETPPALLLNWSIHQNGRIALLCKSNCFVVTLFLTGQFLCITNLFLTLSPNFQVSMTPAPKVAGHLSEFEASSCESTNGEWWALTLDRSACRPASMSTDLPVARPTLRMRRTSAGSPTWTGELYPTVHYY